MAMRSEAENSDLFALTEIFLNHASSVMLGKTNELKLVLSCILARGHLLLEDLPGMGKTTMAKVIGKLLGVGLKRIQFTSDLLPADILGVSIYDERNAQFHFHPGPIFAPLVLGDELNRASPRTQSACLEAMQERQLSIDGVTHRLAETFFFIGTQNPRHSLGTFPLPASQLDRFLMRLELGYPAEQDEKALLMGEGRDRLVESLPAVISSSQLLAIQELVAKIHAAEPVVTYVLRLLRASRTESSGLSPRAGLDLIRCARAWAFLNGRTFLVPEDVQAVATSVLSHRICLQEDDTRGPALLRDLLKQTPVESL